MLRRVMILTSFILPLTPATAQSAGKTALLSVDDYPREAIKRREEGVVRAKLHISAEGRVMSCLIVQSATPLLDAATCRILVRRARFVPAKDQAGAPVENDLVTPPIRWQLPAAAPEPRRRPRGVHM